ncbi:lysozyme inhibitor LprI family protein [Parasedimentitalea denitrificans]|nr:lysozyme inhibitor LprI family protein [Sedimentitalea sp. CY04]
MGSPVSAQEVVYSDEATNTCAMQADTIDDRRQCIGMSANACMENSEEGFTTIGMMECIDKERVYWDGQLNQTYKLLKDAYKPQDAELDSMQSSAPRMVPALRDMQRSWIAYRDATCDFEQSQWGGGSGGGPAVLSCLLRLTAFQSIYLLQTWSGE